MQLDNYILFGSHSKDKLEEFYKNMDLPIEFDDFLNMYYDATKEKYNFFYVDCSGKFRKNFDQEYLLNK